MTAKTVDSEFVEQSLLLQSLPCKSAYLSVCGSTDLLACYYFFHDRSKTP